MSIMNENERRRYRDKIGRLQYIRSLDKEAVMPKGIAKASESMTKDFAEILEKINIIQAQYEEMGKRFESFVGEKDILDSDAGLVVYDALDDKTVWKEKKGFLGKTKWVEEKA